MKVLFVCIVAVTVIMAQGAVPTATKNDTIKAACSDNTHPDCAGWYESGCRVSGVYDIYPTSEKISVYCDMKIPGGGWTVFQRRYDGSVRFDRNWTEYRDGFGDLKGEFWLGNKFLARMTDGPETYNTYKLRVDLKAFDGSTRYAVYTNFIVEPEGAKFKLNIGKYSGTAGDSLSYHRGMYFTTKDKDHDKYRHSCSHYNGRSGYWYNTCLKTSLNGPYHFIEKSHSDKGIHWDKFKGRSKSLQAVSMKFTRQP